MEAQRQIDTTWWAGIDNGKILFQRCGHCGTPIFYPRLACVQCLSSDLEWQECGGHGKIYALTRVHRAPAKEHAVQVPYTVILADMDEGFRLMAKLKKGVEAQAAVGVRVRACMETLEDGRLVPCFLLLDPPVSSGSPS